MTGEIPTKLGDVLLLTGAAIGSLHFVCPVATDGQQGCTTDRRTVTSKAQAVEKARSLVVPDGHIFVKDEDSGEWEEISN